MQGRPGARVEGKAAAAALEQAVVALEIADETEVSGEAGLLQHPQVLPHTGNTRPASRLWCLSNSKRLGLPGIVPR